jgi:Cu-Zn family superoxide dismutase
MRLSVLVAAAALSAGAAYAQSAGQSAAPAAKLPPQPVANAVIQGEKGPVGKAVFQTAPTGVLVTVEVEGLKPGWHGMHFHAAGTCSDPGFKASGAHLNHPARKRPHGLLAAGGPDFGDLPNLWVGADGKGSAQAFTTLVTLMPARGKTALMDADGSALVIHAEQDDQTSQPIGGAGDRIACAVIPSAPAPKAKP